jgi:amidase
MSAEPARTTATASAIDRPMKVVLPTDTIGAFIGAPAVLAVGASGKPLSGLTLAVKDMFDIAGLVTGAGNPHFAADRDAADHTAEAVDRLVQAGATVVGKTITDELAYSLSGTNIHFGMPINVAAPGRVPGGSSAGSAAAVAAGMVDLALGTDTGGSVRVPASYCGIFGWRPTHGAVPITDVVPLAPSFDTVGLFARRIDDLVAGATALLRTPPPTNVPATSIPATTVPATRIPATRMMVLGEAMADVSDDVATEIRRIALSIGIESSVPDAALGIDLGEAMVAFRILQGWEAWQAHGAWIRAQQVTGGPGFGPGIAARFEVASRVTAAEVAAADIVCTRVRRAVELATANNCVLVMPAAAGPAPTPEHDRASHEQQRMGTLRLTCIAGLAGAPVVVLPLGVIETDALRLPLGVALLGAPGADHLLLALAATMTATV